MSIKEWFTIPKDQKITDKAFNRVLISSILSIVLCMLCLSGTTWAWFMVDVENTQNVIEIATITMEATVLQPNGIAVPRAADGSYALLADGTHTLQVQVETNATDLQQTRYVLLSLTQSEGTRQYAIAFENGQTQVTVPVEIHEVSIISFSVAWSVPNTAHPIEVLAPPPTT